MMSEFGFQGARTLDFMLGFDRISDFGLQLTSTMRSPVAWLKSIEVRISPISGHIIPIVDDSPFSFSKLDCIFYNTINTKMVH